MEWATRRKIRISRAATAWLIRRVLDPEATFYFGATDDEVRAREAAGAIGFHVAGTRYAKIPGGPGPFERLVAERRPDDAALLRLAELVGDADGPAGAERHPEAAGLRLMTVAFPEICDDDAEIVARSAFAYDALYAALRKVVAAGARPGP